MLFGVGQKKAGQPTQAWLPGFKTVARVFSDRTPGISSHKIKEHGSRLQSREQSSRGRKKMAKTSHASASRSPRRAKQIKIGAGGSLAIPQAYIIWTDHSG